jgi:ABC-type molybdate transport system substrate-binding protein
MAAGESGDLAQHDPAGGCSDLVWKPMVPPHPGVPSLNGHTDTVPDIVGRLGRPIDLAIFTEGNHFPALLGGEIIEPFRAWARVQREYAALALENITVVTLPQPMIVGILVGGGISLGNLTLEVSRASGFYPDIVMGGAAPLAQLHKGSIVGATARVFARNRGFSLVVAAGNPLAVRTLEDLARPGMRVVLASASEPGARQQYISALEALIGEEAARSILAREVVTFPGRLGIQHRDVLQAIASRSADAGIIFHHLARYFAAAYPQLCTMVTVPGADQFASQIAMVSSAEPLRAQAAKAFSEFFFGVAREVYPRYGFATISEAEFGAPVKLD